MFVVMTVQEATYFLLQQMRTIYPEGEAASITDWVMENLTGSKKAERMIYKNANIAAEEEIKLKVITERLLKFEPVQYVLNESWFCGFRFYVDSAVLIPRPETEELVEEVISHCKFPIDELSVLDIGTGSGCMAVSLKRRIRKADVWACDKSTAALTVAQKNSHQLGAPVHFVEMDFLDSQTRKSLPVFDIIISNPPYIPEKDRATMDPNVLDYEPATALFVPDNDPLVFYHAIADFGQHHLKKGGTIFMEIHESLGAECIRLFREAGYVTTLKKDMQGKDRILKAGKN